MDCKEEGTRKPLLLTILHPCWSVPSGGPGRAALSEKLLVGDGFAQSPFSDSCSSPEDGSLPCLPLSGSPGGSCCGHTAPSICPSLSVSPGWDIHRLCLPVLCPPAPSCHLDTRGLEAFPHVR